VFVEGQEMLVSSKTGEGIVSVFHVAPPLFVEYIPPIPSMT
jgi:hypothetical protein